MSIEVTAAVRARGVDVAFRIGAGETVALLGPNGAGKSTVLAVVAGLLRPDRGRVDIDGRTLTSVDPPVHVAPHARSVALLAQDALLFPHLSVLDNVAFGPRSAGLRTRPARAAAHAWLRRVGAEEYADRRPGVLSGGQAQRVAVARALAAEPRLLLLDEPMAALDVEATPALRQTLRTVLADRSVLLVTHDVIDALLLANRVLVLEEGRVVEEGSTEEVLSRPRSRFAAQLAGLNLVRGVWHGDGLTASSGLRITGRPSEPGVTSGAAAVAVFRPAAVSVHRQPPEGSPRNVVPAVISQVEPHGGELTVRAGDLTAEVTLQAAVELDLAPGDRVWFAVKATEVAIHPG